MGKAQRIRNDRAAAAADEAYAGMFGPGQPRGFGEGGSFGQPTKAAEQLFPAFPYERKFTRDEVAEILERARVMGDRMRDGVGPNGTHLYIPGDLFELWMIHGVLAGADGGRAFIRSRRLPDEHGRLADAIEWVVLKEDTPAARAADDEAEAAAIHAAMTANIRPEVAAAIRRRFVEGARADRLDRATDDAAFARADPPDAFGTRRVVHYGPGDGPANDEGTTP